MSEGGEISPTRPLHLAYWSVEALRYCLTLRERLVHFNMTAQIKQYPFYDTAENSDVPKQKCIPPYPFGPTHCNLHEYLEAAGIMSSVNKQVLVEMYLLRDLDETEHIHDIDPYNGTTVYVAVPTIAKRTGLCDRSVQYAIKALVEAELLERLDKHPETGCYRYRILIHDPYLQILQDNPDHPTHKSFAAAPTVEHIETENAPEMDANEGVQQMHRGGATDAPNKELLIEYTDTNSSHSLAASNSIEPTQEVGEGITDVDLLEPNPPDTQPSPKDKKTSPKGKDAAFFTSPSFRLADKFAQDEVEHTPDKLRKRRAYQFRDQLIKMFHAPRLAEGCPDEAERLEKCVQVLSIWIEIVLDRDNPAESVGFIATEPGMRALTKARKQVFEAYADYQEVELDDNLVMMWEQQYGENWREVRAKRIAGGG